MWQLKLHPAEQLWEPVYNMHLGVTNRRSKVKWVPICDWVRAAPGGEGGCSSPAPDLLQVCATAGASLQAQGPGAAVGNRLARMEMGRAEGDVGGTSTAFAKVMTWNKWPKAGHGAPIQPEGAKP